MAKKRNLKAALVMSVLMLAFLGVPVRDAEADLVTYQSQYSSTTGGNVSLDAINVTPFDPSFFASLMGVEEVQLNEVHVNIFGSTTLSLDTAEQMSGGAFPGPVPYAYTIELYHDLFGETGNYFDFENLAFMINTSVATGYGESVSFDIPFEYDFRFNAETDLSGYAIPEVSGGMTLPGVIFGHVDDFILDPDSPLQDYLWFRQILIATSTNAGPAPVHQISTQLNVTTEYTYVPVPGAFLLGILGLSVAGVKLRKHA